MRIRLFVLAALGVPAAPLLAQSPVIGTLTCTSPAGPSLTAAVYYANINSGPQPYNEPPVGIFDIDLAQIGALVSAVTSSASYSCVLANGSASITLGGTVFSQATGNALSANVLNGDVNGDSITLGNLVGTYVSPMPRIYAEAVFTYDAFSTKGLGTSSSGAGASTLSDALQALKHKLGAGAASGQPEGAEHGGAQ